MKVRVIKSEQIWTKNKLGKVYTVVESNNFEKDGCYRVILNGKDINRVIKLSECRVVSTEHPVTYRDYEEYLFYLEQEENEYYEDMIREYEMIKGYEFMCRFGCVY